MIPYDDYWGIDFSWSWDDREQPNTPYKPNWKERIPEKRLKMHRQRSTI